MEHRLSSRMLLQPSSATGKLQSAQCMRSTLKSFIGGCASCACRYESSNGPMVLCLHMPVQQVYSRHSSINSTVCEEVLACAHTTWPCFPVV